MQVYRQGDVLIMQARRSRKVELEEVPRDNGNVVLAYGEVTGHSHAISDPGAVLFNRRGMDEGIRFLELKNDATLAHEEHSAIQLPAGFYRVIRQREYEPSEAIRTRYVAD